MSEQPKVKVVYRRLRKRLDRMPVGAPRSRSLFEILSILFSEEEAAVAAKMPQKPASVDKISRYTGVDESALRPMLEKMADKGLVMDMLNPDNGKTYYLLAPTVVGFFEFSLMTKRDDIDQKKLAQLFHEYMYEEKDFGHNVFRGRTQLGRALVHETALTDEQRAGILPYESATAVVEAHETRAITMCYCRHKGALTDEPCEFSLDICMSIGDGADYLIRHKLARAASKTEMLEKLAQARELGLVQMGDNVKENVGFICNCCGCHCGVLGGTNVHGIPFTMNTSSFIAAPDADACKGCGLCAQRCPISAISMQEYTRADGKVRQRAVVDEKFCLGCGVCVGACKPGCMHMEPRPARVITPENTIERVVSMALERGSLGALMFDDESRTDQRFMRRFVNAVLTLPPARQAMLNDTLRSRFLSFMMQQVVSGAAKSGADGAPKP
jgi:ferredoxin